MARVPTPASCHAWSLRGAHCSKLRCPVLATRQQRFAARGVKTVQRQCALLHAGEHWRKRGLGRRRRPSGGVEAGELETKAELERSDKEPRERRWIGGANGTLPPDDNYAFPYFNGTLSLCIIEGTAGQVVSIIIAYMTRCVPNLMC
jgi:hypothetical protein